MPYVIEGSDVDGKLFYLYLLHTRVYSTPLFTHVPNSKGQRATRDQVSQSDARAIKGKRQSLCSTATKREVSFITIIVKQVGNFSSCPYI